MAEKEIVIDCHNHIGVELLFYLHGDHPYCQSVPEMVENAGASRLTHWMVFPFVTNLSCRVPSLREGKVEVDDPPEHIPYAYENRRLMQEIYDYFPEHANRLLPLIIVDPSRAIDAQIQELRKLREKYRFYGIKIQATIIQSPIRGLLNEGAALVDLAREWDLPFLIHSSIAGNDHWSQCSDILDIAEANPDVRFCLAHSCRYDQPSLERMASMNNTWIDCSAHVIHCESVIRELPNIAVKERRFASNYSDPAEVLHDLYQAYPDKLMWGSDSPFYSWIAMEGRLPFALKTTYQEETDCLFALPEEARKKVSHLNISQYLNKGDESIFSQ